jgi:hypothetical protein
MKHMAVSKKETIEFKHITGQDMIEEIKELFFRICPVIENRSFLSKF